MTNSVFLIRIFKGKSSTLFVPKCGFGTGRSIDGDVWFHFEINLTLEVGLK